MGQIARAEHHWIVASWSSSSRGKVQDDVARRGGLPGARAPTVDAVRADAPDLGAIREELAAEGIIEPGRAAVQHAQHPQVRAPFARRAVAPAQAGNQVWTISFLFPFTSASISAATRWASAQDAVVVAAIRRSMSSRVAHASASIGSCKKPKRHAAGEPKPGTHPAVGPGPHPAMVTPNAVRSFSTASPWFGKVASSTASALPTSGSGGSLLRPSKACPSEESAISSLIEGGVSPQYPRRAAPRRAAGLPLPAASRLP